METIISKNNPSVQSARKLLSKKYRVRENKFLIEGEILVRDLDPDCVLRYYVSSQYAKVTDASKTLRLSQDVFQTLCETVHPSGIIAEMEIPPQKYEQGKDTLLLDKISDPGNLGTLLRTAACCSFTNVILIGCADPYEGKAVRASMGGVLNVNVTLCGSYEEAFALVGEQPIYAMDMNGQSLTQTAAISPIVLAVGNEAKGLSAEMRQRSKLISLPMSGKVESLNAAVAGSVGMYVLKYFIK